MIAQRDILQEWGRGKASDHGYRLRAEITVEFEYRGPQFGHPSNYASIKILATPASELHLESSAVYPASVTEEYAKDLLIAVGRAAVEELFATGWYAYRGCKLVVREVACTRG